MKVLVTGASGFIGSALIERLTRDAQHTPIASTARLAASTDWSTNLQGIDIVIHCAARVHMMQETATNPLEAFRAINTEGTRVLAEQAAAAGAKRFIFLSSIKVNGEATIPGKPFTAEDTPNPQDAYGISKHEAEEALRHIGQQTGMEIVIIRPPLVYGPGMKGNMASLLKLIGRGIPLPLGAINNKRSLVARANVIDLLVTCLTHPAAANQTFLVSDAAPLSTPDLIRAMAQAVGKPARLLPIPSALLRMASQLIGKPDIAERLCGSLEVDIRSTQERLGWTTPVALETAMREAVIN